MSFRSTNNERYYPLQPSDIISDKKPLSSAHSKAPVELCVFGSEKILKRDIHYF